MKGLIIKNGKFYLKTRKGEIPLVSPSPVSLQVLHRPKGINFSLLFNKYWWKWKWEKEDGFVKLELIKSAEELKEIIQAFPWEHLRDFQRKMEDFIERLKAQVGEENLCEMTLRASQRLVVGLGAVHLHETTMVLHHTFGVPYIPASAVKGMVRSWLIEKIWEKSGGEQGKGKAEQWLEKGEIAGEDGKPRQKEMVQWGHRILGGEKEKGAVVFLDAYPLSLRLSVDVINPHYPKYYQGKEPPSDWQNPVPVFFLTVDKGSKFRFSFFIGEKAGKEEREKLREKTEQWLKEALLEHGLGAKTSIGYGIFKG